MCMTTLYSQPCSPFKLYLLDNHRISQLYLSTGKTKKTLPSLAEIQPRLALTSCSRNGAYLAGLTMSGQLFIWHQPTEVLELFQTPLSSPQDTTEEEKRGHSSQAFQGMYFSLVMSFSVHSVHRLLWTSYFLHRCCNLTGASFLFIYVIYSPVYTY